MDKRTGRNRARGQGMVEFAIVLPLLLLLLFGIFEFGRIMFIYSAAVTASREAARYGAAIFDTGGGVPQYEDCEGIKQAANRIGQYTGITDADIAIQYSNSSGIYSTSCPPSQEVQAADTISITINTSVAPITPVGNFPAIPISSSSSRTILKNVQLGFTGTGAGSVSGSLSDVNFKTTSQVAVETQGTISVVLELNSVAADVVTIPFSISGTAFEGSGNDFLITPSPIIINPGEKTATIYISLNNDGITEGEENLLLGIGNPINATKGPQDLHIITIIDPPEITFETANSVHSESSSTTALMIKLSKYSTQDVTVSFNYSGWATWGVSGDYYSNQPTVTIPAGSLSGMLMLEINDDTIDEEDENGIITLTSPVNGLVGSSSTHTLTIIDDDFPPSISFFSPNQIVSEEIGVFTTSLTLSEISGKTITVPYTISGTTIPADYVIHDSSPLVIPAGSNSVDISMDILEGDGWEEDETLILTLGTPTNADLGSPAAQTIVITEESFVPTVNFASSGFSVVEGNTIVNIDVQLSNAWSSVVFVHYSISGSAQEGSGADYTITSSPLNIPVGWTQRSIQVEINDDQIDEVMEDIQVSMTQVDNATVGTLATHIIQIVDNDAAPIVYYLTPSTSASENSGLVTVNVELNNSSVHDVSIPLNISGTATQGSDYSISTTNLNIPAGTTSGSFQIYLTDDVVYDPNETIIVDLGYPTNADLGSPASFTLTIEDNDLSPCEVGSHLLTVDTDSFSLSIVNKGEALVYTGGTVTWSETLPNQPYLLSASFAGTTVFSGGEKPTSHSHPGGVDFNTLSTESVSYQFDGSLGAGVNTIISNFQNPNDGTNCSLTEVFTTH